jgi:uncharacterized protein YbjT (DUF2867 family)
VSALRVLFIGGSGIISSACCQLAVQRGLDIYVLNRGATKLRPLPAEVTIMPGDVRDPSSVQDALGGREFESTPISNPYWLRTAMTSHEVSFRCSATPGPSAC